MKFNSQQWLDERKLKIGDMVKLTNCRGDSVIGKLIRVADPLGRIRTKDDDWFPFSIFDGILEKMPNDTEPTIFLPSPHQDEKLTQIIPCSSFSKHNEYTNITGIKQQRKRMTIEDIPKNIKEMLISNKYLRSEISKITGVKKWKLQCYADFLSANGFELKLPSVILKNQQKEKQYNHIVTLLKQGISRSDICHRLKLQYNYIKSVAEKEGIPLSFNKRNNAKPSGVLKKTKELISNGMTNREVASCIGYPEKYVAGVRRRMKEKESA